jgi:hypothetical protein
MFFCLRVDLDYVPWDSPDASEFGHGEPAMLLKLLELGRFTGYKFHFFASNRVFRALSAVAEAVLNDGHDLDWLCKHPEHADARFRDAVALAGEHGHHFKGMAVRGSWPAGATFEGIETLEFLTAQPGPIPGKLRLFPVEIRSARDAYRSGISARAWTDSAKAALREYASRNLSTTIVVRPQVLAKFDPRLGHVREILDLAQAADMQVRTLRDVMHNG